MVTFWGKVIIFGGKFITFMGQFSPEKSWHGSDPPLLGGAKIAAVVLHTMNIEGQIHQKNPGMGQTPPPLSGNARILEAPVIAIAP